MFLYTQRVLLLSFVAATCATAQWTDSSGNPVDDIRPVFRYYAVDDPLGTIDQYGQSLTAGSLTIMNAGPNGVVDSIDNQTRRVDDAGMISLIVSRSVFSTFEVALPIFADGISWQSSSFPGVKLQVAGNAISGAFLPVRETETVLLRLPGGLGYDYFTDFDDGLIHLETGQNDQAGTPGRTLFASLDPADTQGLFTIVVPEPSLPVIIAPVFFIAVRLRTR